METAAALHGQAHMLMLCVCGTVIMLAAHTAQGVPVLRKSGTTPQWPAKPVPHTYIPKRFLRIWAEKQDELMMEGPSGDGPLDAWDSPMLPGKTSETHQTSDDYATRSPLPEDIFPSQSEPFPSIIDTEIESSETLRDEFISRSSVPFHGPSSLLNTLIFRPSLPDETSSSVIPTPTTSSSTFAQTSPYHLSASWTEINEAASSFRMSSRRALSYSPSEVFAIITAISATYIYQEDSEALAIDPSNAVSGYPFGSLPSNETSLPSERLPDQQNTSAFNISVHLQNSDASYFSKTPILYESYHSVSEIQPSFTTNLFPVGVSGALTDGSSHFSSSINPSISTDEHPLTTESSLFHFANLTGASFALINPSFTQWNSYSASLTIHTSSLSTEAYYFSNNTLDGSFVQSLLLQQSTDMIPLLTPQRTFFLSNVETTVTIIDNKDTPFTYVLPTLTVTGTTFSGTYGIFTSYPEDFSLIPSLENEMEVTIFNDFSTFKHLSSSFDTFSTTDSIQRLRSTFSHISMEKIISANSSVFENETDFFQSKSASQFPKPSSPASTYAYFSTVGLLNEIIETGASSEMPFKKYSVSETIYRPELSVFSEAFLNKTEDFSEDFESSKTLIHEVQTKMKTTDFISVNEIDSYQQMTPNISAEYSPSPILPSNIFTTMFEHNETLSTISEMFVFESLTTSFHTEVHIDSSLKSTDVLSNEVTKQDGKSKNEEAATFIQSEDLQFSSSTIKDEISTDSRANFLDPFTHHITVRSLRDTSNFDILTRVLFDLSTSNGFDARNSASGAMEESFSRISTTKHVSNLHEIEISPTLSSMSLLHGKSEALLPDFVTSHTEQEITAYVSLFSKNLLDDDSSMISSKSEIYFLESSFIPLKTLYSENLFHSQSTTYLSDQYLSSYNQRTILPHNQSDFTESYTVASSNLPLTYKGGTAGETFSEPLKSIQTSINEHSLESLPSDDFGVTNNFNSSILPSEMSLEPIEMSTSLLLFTNNLLTSVSTTSKHEEYSTILSQLDNNLLESSNASSKALDGTLSLINESKSGEIDLKSESEESSLLTSKSSESHLNIFASDYFMTPSFPLSSINLETASSGADSTFELEEPKRSYFEFHESTRILEPEIKPLTPRLFSSSDYVRSAIYDSSETSNDILKDFKVSSTLITDFYQPSLQSNLFSLLEPESPFVSSPSKKVTFSSFVAIGHSDIKSKTIDSAVSISYDKSPSSEVVSFSQIQPTKSLDITLETEQVSLLSSIVESSFPEMSVLDLSTYFRELSLLSKVSSPVWSPDLFSTAFKQPRSMDSFLAKHETETYFSSHLSPRMLSATESDLSSLIISSVKELENIKSKPTQEVLSLIVTPLLSVSSWLSEVQQTEMFSLKHPLSLHSDYQEFQSADGAFLSSEYVYTSLKTSLESVIFSSTKEPSVKESYFPLPVTTSILSSTLSSRHSLSVSLFSSPMHPTSVEYYFPKSILSPTMSNILSSERYPLTSSKSKEPLSEESYHQQPVVSPSLSASALPSYESMISEQSLSNVFSSFRIKEPVSIESDQPELHLTRTFATPILPYSNSNYDTPPVYPKEELKSIESMSPKSRTYFTRAISQTPVLPHSDYKPYYDTPPVYPKEEPKSMDFMLPQSRNYFTRTVLQTPILPHSDFKPRYDTPPVYPKEEPKSKDSMPPQSITFFIRTASRILDPSDLAKLLPTPSYAKIIEPQSIESDFPRRKVSSSLRSPFFSHASFWSVKPQFDAVSSTTLRRLESSISRIEPTSAIELSPVILSTEVSSTWLSTVPDSTDVILVSVLPISSFLNVNQTKNGTGDRSHLDESHSTEESEAIPTRNTFLFKDNHYWILTVLEAPAKGQLPENFSHIMENRLANAYSEAFRSWPKKKDDAKEDIVVVKILSVTDDLLLRQLDIVYVVERGGSLVPSDIAAEYLNSLRFEQLREFLGYHAIEKARPYRPPGGDVIRPVGSPLPVLAIVGGLLLALLLIFCCICLYCRCCRPKPAPASPGSSASGSLQRSLSKYGQHNRKHLFREMTHQLTAEMAAQIKHGSTAPDAYRPEKSALSGRSLPALPRESDDSEKRADPSMKMLRILENKEASTSPMPGKQSRGTDGTLQSSDTSSAEKKKPPPKPKKRRKVKESGDQASRNAVPDSVAKPKESKPESPPPTPPPKRDVSIPSAGHSPDSGTSSRQPSSQPSSSSEKEAESEGSNTELLPPIQDLIDRSKSESEAAAAEAQMHLSRVRQRISELLDDAFAMAGGRRLYGSLRSKKIEPTTEVLPRFGSFRSQSATQGELTTAKRQGRISIERRPISEGGQRLLGVLTDEGQLITHPPPKLVWDQDEGHPLQGIESPLGPEMVEARNRNINLFPFQPQRIHQLPALPSSSSLPLLDTLPESRQDDAGLSPTHALREAASELYLPLSAMMNPATGDQYDELDVVSALRNGEPVEALIQAIKDELQRFAGSLPGAEDGESNA